MGKILVLGNEQPTGILSNLPDAQFLPMPIFSLGEAGERKLNQFINKNIADDADTIIVDADSDMLPEYCLAIVASIRLSLFEIKHTALAPIILSTEQTQDVFKGNKYSTVILTGSVYIETPQNVSKVLGAVRPLEANEYRSKFLDLIKILPNANEGRHSIANQWGADVLSRIVLGPNAPNENIREARLSFYFKYVQALTLERQDVEQIVDGNNPMGVASIPQTQRPNATGKNILLIDDEAEKGWSFVLENMLLGSRFETICEKVSNYDGLSDEAHRKIEQGDYDLIFLDLRMNGVAEEGQTNPADFSGMKILKKIKELNKGTQVIMFTASNKAWNLKALLDAGANGYYIKESPENAFPFSYSENNAQELGRTIERCFGNGYLRKIYRKIQEIKRLIIVLPNLDEKWKNEATMSIDVAFDLLAKSDVDRVYVAYAYLQLFQSIEKYVTNPSLIDDVDSNLFLYGSNNQRYRIAEKRNKDEWKSCISMRNGHYVLQEGNYINRRFDTNFRVSAFLIYKFGNVNSSVCNWTDVYRNRNDIAHSNNYDILTDDIHMIIDFMRFFFSEEEVNWRDVSDALPDISEEEQLAQLLERFNHNRRR